MRKKSGPNHMLLKEIHSKFKYIDRLKVQGWRKISCEHLSPKSRSSNINIRKSRLESKENYQRRKKQGGHYIRIKGPI